MEPIPPPMGSLPQPVEPITPPMGSLPQPVEPLPRPVETNTSDYGIITSACGTQLPRPVGPLPQHVGGSPFLCIWDITCPEGPLHLPLRPLWNQYLSLCNP